MNETIGLIAGESLLPLLSLRQARNQGYTVVVAGIRKTTDESVRREAPIYKEFSLGEIGRLLRYFHTHGVDKAVMVGRVGHVSIFQLISLDRKYLELVKHVNANTSTALLASVADFFASQGIEILDSTLFLQEFLAGNEIYTPGIHPSKQVVEDIEFGWKKAWGIADLDIGQTICVKKKAVVAVEAMEGTDRTIQRAFELAGRGMVVVKVSRPGGDMRFDVPVIGPKTLTLLADVHASALVVEAGKTLLIEKKKIIDQAKKARLLMVGKT